MLINGKERDVSPAADLWGANLRSADLWGANLRSANLQGAKGVIVGAERSDGYRFVAWFSAVGMWINAGCRSFTIVEARAHWTATREGTPLGDETFAILDCLEALAKIRGFVK